MHRAFPGLARFGVGISRAEDVHRRSKLQYKELGARDDGFSISMMIEAVLATKLPGILLAEEDLNSVSAMFVTG